MGDQGEFDGVEGSILLVHLGNGEFSMFRHRQLHNIDIYGISWDI
jgi:hypothetical protein